MVTETITLHKEDFFHARPASGISSAAKPFESVMMLMVGSEIADIKDVLSLMRLGHPHGQPVELLADGPDEQAALQAVAAAIRREFSL